MSNAIDAKEFLEVVRPALHTCDASTLAQVVRVRWRPAHIRQLMRHDDVDVRRVAALALGLIGSMSSTSCLTRALRDNDKLVNQMAEHGLWSIWFRSGNRHAVEPFREGVALLATEDYEQAIEQFHEANRIDPNFAEAYNQCAIAHYFLAHWEASIRDCQRTVRLISTHFGAIAGMGHCYAQMGELGHALRFYRQALRINPRMPAMARAAQRLESAVPATDPLSDFSVDYSRN